jgi:hypothetical protein
MGYRRIPMKLRAPIRSRLTATVTLIGRMAI